MQQAYFRKRIDKEFSFYDFNTLESKLQKGAIIGLFNDKGLIRFGDTLCDSALFSQYLISERELIAITLMIASELNETQCILRKYDSTWLHNREAFQKLEKWLISNSITNRRKAFLIETKSELLTEWLAAIIRGYSFVQILFPINRVVISPSDHLNIFVDAKDHEIVRRIVDKVLAEFPNVRLLKKPGEL